MTTTLQGIIQSLQLKPSETMGRMSEGEIVEVLRAAADHYYNTDETIMSDDLFDMLKDELKERNPKHPFLKQVGAPVQIQGNKVKLPYWMGSLDKIRDDAKGLEKWKATYAGHVVISDKLDGNSALFVADKNGNAALYSRGDGYVGQDVSHLIPLIQGLPKNVKDVAVRGELIISKAAWEKIQDVGANARNVVAGAMHNKNPSQRIANSIEFVAYEILHKRESVSTQHDILSKQLGFNVVSAQRLPTESLDTTTLSKILMFRRAESPYEVDGIVVAHDDVHTGAKGTNPKYAFAFKSLLTHEEAEVTVLRVEWNVSKDGYLKPLIHFHPVILAGATIQKATGFNASYIEQHKIGPGSKLVIIRSGDVIPHVLRVLAPSSNKTPSMPEDIEYEWNETRVDIRLKASAKNDQQDIKQMLHFVKTMDMAFLGEGTLKKLHAAGINTIPKLLNAKIEDFTAIDGFQGVMSTKLVSSIEAAKTKAKCIDYMVASNLFGRGLGMKKMQTLIKAIPSIESLELPSHDKLMSVEGIGPSTAAAFLEGFPKFVKFAQEIGFDCSMKTQPSNSNSDVVSVKSKLMSMFQGKTVVFTGFRDADLERLISSENVGGKVTTSVSKNTDIVIATDIHEQSSKLEKARALGIQIVSRDSVTTMA